MSYAFYLRAKDLARRALAETIRGHAPGASMMSITETPDHFKIFPECNTSTLTVTIWDANGQEISPASIPATTDIALKVVIEYPRVDWSRGYDYYLDTGIIRQSKNPSREKTNPHTTQANRKVTA